MIISDRSKDLVKTGGEWISSVDLENHIVSLNGVAQACVVAQPHPKWDEASSPDCLGSWERGIKRRSYYSLLKGFCEVAIYLMMCCISMKFRLHQLVRWIRKLLGGPGC